MVCRKCGNTNLAEETKEELLDVLTLSVALSWRRLYPEDVYFVRSRMGLKKTEFERIAGVDEKNLTISGFKGKKPEENEFMIDIEDHPVYISDQISDNIKKLALGLVNAKTIKILENKWFFPNHHLGYPHSNYAKKNGRPYARYRIRRSTPKRIE